MLFRELIELLKGYERIGQHVLDRVIGDYLKIPADALSDKDLLKLVYDMVISDYWIEELADNLSISEEEFKVQFYELKNRLLRLIFNMILDNLEESSACGQTQYDSE